MLYEKSEKEMLEMYLRELQMQFMASNGVKNSEDLLKLESEFTSWVTTMYGIKKKYAQIISDLNKRDGVIAELGKGVYDSVATDLQDLGEDAIIVTPYAELFNRMVNAYNGLLVNVHDEAFIMYQGQDTRKQKSLPNCNPIFNENIGTLITQLPTYINNQVDINSLIKTCSLSNDIIIGSYGNTNDKDKKEKIDVLREIRERILFLNGVICEEEYVEENGTYQHLLVTNQMTLVKRMVR